MAADSWLHMHNRGAVVMFAAKFLKGCSDNWIALKCNRTSTRDLEERGGDHEE